MLCNLKTDTKTTMHYLSFGGSVVENHATSYIQIKKKKKVMHDPGYLSWRSQLSAHTQQLS